MSLLQYVHEKGHQMGSPALVIEPTGAKDLGPCACCGDNSRKVWGLVHRGTAGEGAYFVEWTLGQIARHGANFDLILGKWGDGTTREDRYAVSFEFQRTEQGPAFMIIDATDRDVSRDDLVRGGLRRDEVIGTDAAKQAFDIIDAIWVQDARIEEIRRAG